MVAERGLRIVYFGTPAFAVPSLVRLLDSNHRVVALVSQPDRPSGRGHRVQPTPTKTVALTRGLPVLQPERIKETGFHQSLSALRPDLGVVAAYGRILPDALLALPRLGMINVHASVLPAYRGPAPVHRAVMAGDTETGVTIMRVASELDAGATFAMRRRAIDPEETSTQVEHALAELGADLVVDVVDQIAAGRAVETPQDDSRATFAPKVTKAEGPVDWTLPAQVVHNRVRGLQPWPMASTRFGDTRLLIHRTTLMERDSEPLLSTLPAGYIVSATADGIDVLCGDGNLLRILDVQPEGRRAMSVRDFLAGHRVQRGTLLEGP
jgi:methionyl-tRNA formyltransferase